MFYIGRDIPVPLSTHAWMYKARVAISGQISPVIFSSHFFVRSLRYYAHPWGTLGNSFVYKSPPSPAVINYRDMVCPRTEEIRHGRDPLAREIFSRCNTEKILVRCIVYYYYFVVLYQVRFDVILSNLLHNSFEYSNRYAIILRKLYPWDKFPEIKIF